MLKSIKQNENKPCTFGAGQKGDCQKYISIHAPKAKKAVSEEEFGHFLAGLIDSDGSIAKPGYVQIDFHTNDISVAYYIKKRIGYGKISQEKKRFSVRYRCTPTPGLVLIADLIRNKLKHSSKIDQFNSRLVPKLNCDPTTYTDCDILQNHWLAGFIQGDGCLSILQCKNRNKTSLKSTIVIQISQKTEKLLSLIQTYLGGYVGYRKSQDTFYYITGSFTSAVLFINYLDRFQLMGNKLTQYWLWRKAYLVFQTGLHLTPKGEAKLSLKKAQLSKLRANKLETLSQDDLDYRLQAKLKRKAKRSASTVTE
uniref:Putative LAGLIDADG homing endonuclease n=1 Tax=Hazenia capsulata TaxID=2202518 RepID=A0A1W6EHK8_9CHLO|nr:putative LAGLIDADG homing endonuclease [Hazenia capsulata]ARK14902.1 putative LAGLIDADG homing endonuclease [Hazenia capsulata]